MFQCNPFLLIHWGLQRKNFLEKLLYPNTGIIQPVAICDIILASFPGSPKARAEEKKRGESGNSRVHMHKFYPGIR